VFDQRDDLHVIFVHAAGRAAGRQRGDPRRISGRAHPGDAADADRHRRRHLPAAQCLAGIGANDPVISRSARICKLAAAKGEQLDVGDARLPISAVLNDDRHVACSTRQKFHQPPDRHRHRPATHQRGNLSLGSPEELGSLFLGKILLLDELVDLYGELGFEKLLFGVRQTEICKDVAAAFFVRCHDQPSFTLPVYSRSADFRRSRMSSISRLGVAMSRRLEPTRRAVSAQIHPCRYIIICIIVKHGPRSRNVGAAPRLFVHTSADTYRPLNVSPEFARMTR